MIFKRIEMSGFKSFADKIDVEFEGGMTAIVGPNGCGKSNIADAVRWVLGEQSSKLLRGQNMQDVIFSGTEKRKSLSYTEVSLVFDNKSRIFPLEFSEVSLTRKLYRSGESDYLINKEPCRLKDIVANLHDAHIGKEGYSIIGQGRVEQIISAKPEDRRPIFEEAAGISKHKAKKLESERRLARVKENKIRIEDIIAEQERTLAPMEKQAENAKKYLDIREQLKTLEANIYINKYDKTNEVKQAISAEIRVLNEEIENKTKEQEKLNTHYIKTQNEISDLDDKIKEFYNDILNINISLEKASGEHKLYGERLSFLASQKETFETEKESLESSLRDASFELASNKEDIAKKELLLKELVIKKEDVLKNYLEIVNILAKSEDEALDNQKEIVNSLTTLGDVKALKSKTETEIELLRQKETELNDAIMKGEREKIVLESKIRVISDELENIFIRQKELLKEKDEKNVEYASLLNRIETLENETMQLKTEEGRLSSKLKLLEDLKNDNEGFGYSVRKILDAGKIRPEIKKLYEGTVAGLFKVDAKFETALETLLGNSLQHMVTNNEEDSKKLIEFLKQNKYGRITCLPLSSVKPRRIDSEFVAAVRAHGIDVAINLVSFDRKYQQIFESLLGGCVICETIDKAIMLAKQTNFAFKIVSLEGDLLNPAGSISGGSKKNEGTSLLSREREIEEFKQGLIKVQQSYANSSAELTSLKLSKITFDKDLARLADKLKFNEIEEVKKLDEKEKYETELLVILNGKTAKKNELLESSTKMLNFEKTIINLNNRENEIISGKTENSESLANKQKQHDNLRKQRDLLSEELTTVKVKISGTETELNSLSVDNMRLTSDVENLTKKIKTTNENIDRAIKTIEACEKAQLGAGNTELAKQEQEKLAVAREKLDKMDEYKKIKNENLADIEQRRLLNSSDIMRVNENKMNKEISLSRVDTDLEILAQRLLDEYNLDYAGAIAYKEEEFNLAESEDKAFKLKKDISRLGSVNVNAIEDILDLKTRHTEYVTQRDDLIAAEADITKVIKELSNEMHTRFDEDFKVICENFEKTFKELFGGGSAKLILIPSEDNDPLNAGIDIVAQPPGKKLQSITLLSGGEKALTAIAILFAILKLRPMPFCLLDEIEAALDEANVARFASYLKRFSKETQFIVITHRKPTMELADSLYGVTMEEKGVSKIVSVKLSEALKADKG